MQTRERRLLLVTAMVVALWPIDRLLLQPLGAWYERIDEERRRMRLDLQEASALLERRRAIVDDWQRLHNSGLLEDAATAGYRLQRAVATAAEHSHLRVANLGGARHRPAAGEERFDRVEINLRAEGDIASCRAFLRALGGLDMPLHIERCELQARDVTRDLLDCSLTLSTRIVREDAREGRRVVETVGHWQADEPPPLGERPGLLFRAVRSTPGDQHPAPIVVREPPQAEPLPVAAPLSWSLVGLVCRSEAGDGEAFLRHQGDGTERILRAGDEIDGRRIVAVRRDGLLVTGPDDPATGEDGEPPAEHPTTLILPGYDLLGRPAGGARATGPGPSSADAATTGEGGERRSPFSTPAKPADSSQQAILERLRQQRLRTRN